MSVWTDYTLVESHSVIGTLCYLYLSTKVSAGCTVVSFKYSQLIRIVIMIAVCCSKNPAAVATKKNYPGRENHPINQSRQQKPYDNSQGKRETILYEHLHRESIKVKSAHETSPTQTSNNASQYL